MMMITIICDDGILAIVRHLIVRFGGFVLSRLVASLSLLLVESASRRQKSVRKKPCRKNNNNRLDPKTKSTEYGCHPVEEMNELRYYSTHEETMRGKVLRIRTSCISQNSITSLSTFCIRGQQGGFRIAKRMIYFLRWQI